MKRRTLLRGATAQPLLRAVPLLTLGSAVTASRSIAAETGAAATMHRVRPGDHGWPNDDAWQRLNDAIGGRLVKVRAPLETCIAAAASAACDTLFKDLHNPYYIGDEPGLSQTLGWVDAWTFKPSVYAVAAEKPGDIAAAIAFANQHRLRVAVKGGGHSYQGTSNAPDSLLLWTRHMKAITMHDAFVPAGCPASDARHAVSVEAGAMWMQVYDVVTTQNGRYVQGGGCTTVGVAGLVSGGGFGSFSKRFGTGGGSLLEAEVVTADGEIRIANACTNADLFWALKGGGGGSFGVMTRLTLETHELPATFGIANMVLQARSDAAYRQLIGRVLAFYKTSLFNDHWGEQIRFKWPRRRVSIEMVIQGLSKSEAEAVWKPFLDALRAAPDDFAVLEGPQIAVFPARVLWDAKFLKSIPGVVKSDDRPGAPPGDVFWSGNAAEAGQVLHGYDSVWLPQSLLGDAQIESLADAVFAAARQWQVSLHVNKGLAGAPPKALDAARDTPMNPAVLDAFALAIIAGEEGSAYPGIAGHGFNVSEARDEAGSIRRAMAELRKVAPSPGSYLSESNYFEPHWREAFWGAHHARLAAIKQRVDPDGLFIVHHGVGSEGWSDDGFTRLA